MPNPPLPAGAPGLPAVSSTRRAILATLAGIGAALSLPKTVQAMSAMDDADASVAELTRAYDAAMAHTRRTLDAMEAAERRVVRPPVPEALFAREKDPLLFSFGATPHPLNGRLWFGAPDRVERLRSWDTNAMSGPIWARVVARRTEILTVSDRWDADQKAAEDAAGLTAARAEYKAAWEKDEKPALHRVVALRSLSPAALRLRARVYAHHAEATDWRAELDKRIAAAEGEGMWEDAVGLSVLRDTLAAHSMGVVA